MVLGQRYHRIQALLPMSLSHSAFAYGPHGGCDDLKTEVCERLIESMREDDVAVMEDQPVTMVRRPKV
jgi:hypothetical protein